ncbi:MAG TPA: DUF2145 domain-containing protein [Thermoanaerobaculia bacterium]|nr:DUF2145 domain-containing protein [Thermoanaerobaculia bacterium]
MTAARTLRVLAPLALGVALRPALGVALRPALGLALAFGLTGPAAAAECELVPNTLWQVRQAIAAGSRLVDRLDETPAEVAIVGRIGSDQSERGIRYTHAGLAWRDHPAGRWHFVHLLNHCGSERSELFDDGPVTFFMERPFRYDAWVMVPDEEVQRSIVELLREGVDGRLHEPRYSAIAHPFRARFQNSNQWLLELVALALDPGGPPTRERAQQVLRLEGFEPERVRLGFFERVGARRRENVSLSDHARSELRDGGYLYVSVASVARFLDQVGVLAQSFEIPADSAP